MRDVLDDLKTMHKEELARVPGHWTVDYLARGITEIERLRTGYKTLRMALVAGDTPDATMIDHIDEILNS